MTRRDCIIVSTCLAGAAMCARGMAGNYPAQDLRAALNAALWAMETYPDTCICAVLGCTVLGAIIALCAWACGQGRRS